MLERRLLEKQEEERLAPYAIKSSQSRGRQYKEKEHLYRTVFQRDRDRIIHSTAFRRLQYKTQVFVNYEGDHYRTRLTHTLEVLQISKTIARSLNLNEDLVEAIALAHDIGHPPFGHSGEKTLHNLMKGYGGFEHNRQALRIVDYLEERYPNFRGLNLTWEVREGIIKHTTIYDTPEIDSFDLNKNASLETQVVNASDEIAYNNHDLDDGITSGLISMEEIDKIELWKSAYMKVERRYPELNKKIKKSLIIRELINMYVSDLLNETEKNLKRYKIKSPEDARNIDQKIVSNSASFNRKKEQISNFLFDNLYNHPHVIRMSDKADRFIKQLFTVYVNKPKLIPTEFLKLVEKDGVYRVICDYIAGMTDRFALNEYKKLFEPYEKV